MNAASGISNKAFYEVATRLDLDRAAQIWVAALPELSKRVTFAVMAQATANSAKSLLGTEAQAKVQEAWQKVGL
jgi:Zn-dependent metalloprotease